MVEGLLQLDFVLRLVFDYVPCLYYLNEQTQLQICSPHHSGLFFVELVLCK